MSNRRNDNAWSLGGAATAAVGVGVLAGLGYALYKSSQDEASPVKAVVDSFFGRIEKCVTCGKEFLNDTNKIQLLCNHLYHKSCLLSSYNQHTMMSLKQFLCPEKECFFKIPDSVINSLKNQVSSCFRSSSLAIEDRKPASLALSQSTRMSYEDGKCKICNRDLEFTENVIDLDCNHKYHKNCILSNYVVQKTMGKAEYYCPILSCKRLISGGVVQSILE